MIKTLKTLQHEQFLLKFKNNQLNLFNSLQILTKYKRKDYHILVKTKYGICKTMPQNLLKGSFPTIKSSLDKHSYFINCLLEKQPDFLNNFKFKSTYINDRTNILIEDNYGVCSLQPTNLLNGSKPSIRSAINQSDYFKNYVLKKYKYKYKYNYDLVEYKNSNSKINIKCLKHGIFKQRASAHLEGQGCPKCKLNLMRERGFGFNYTKWKKLGESSKNFDSFKVYILRCWNDNEIFFKIGKTFMTMKKRFPSKFEMPYKYKEIKIFEGDPIEMSKLEKFLHQKYKSQKYIPKITFHGEHECFFYKIRK